MIKIFVITTGLLFVGCGGSKPVPQKSVKIVEEKLVVKESKPKWIANPNIDGNVGAIGIIELMKNKKKQKYIAKKLAIAFFQNQKKVSISGAIIDSTTIKNDDVTEEVSSIIEQKSNHFKTESLVIKDEYSDKENYYVWMVIKR